MRTLGLALLLPWAMACSETDAPVASCPVVSASAPDPSAPLTYSGISSGKFGTCVVASDGQVLCWSYDERADATTVADVTNARRVVVGSEASCAIRDGGSVLCWRGSDPPEQVLGLCGAIELVSGSSLTCAVTSRGEVWCQGRLSIPGMPPGDAESVVRIPGVTGAKAIALGSNGYTCALIEDGSVVCWGGGPRGQDRPSGAPAAVPEISGAIALAGADGAAVCAVLADQTVSCWKPSEAPVLVEGLSQVASLSVGTGHSCASLLDGTVRCWGTNGSGELGDGAPTDSDVPVRVQQLEGVQEVSVGSFGSFGPGFSCALRRDGSVACWGARTQPNANGDWMASPTPVRVRFP